MSSLFEKVFADLGKLGERNSGANKHLKALDFDTSIEDSDKLISEFKEIRYASNTNVFFLLLFPNHNSPTLRQTTLRKRDPELFHRPQLCEWQDGNKSNDCSHLGRHGI